MNLEKINTEYSTFKEKLEKDIKNQQTIITPSEDCCLIYYQ